MPPLPIILILVYGTFILAGGLIGYWKAGSKASLIAGVVSAAALAVAFWIGQSNGVVGLCIAAGVALLLSVVFLIRFLKTRAVMPSGMMLAVSVAAAVYFAWVAKG
jgi:uncharacterized membrane protein (UPF0136 family)